MFNKRCESLKKIRLIPVRFIFLNNENNNMAFFKELATGIKNYVAGFKFLVEHKLWWYFIFPAVLSIGIYFLGVYFDGLQDGRSLGRQYNPETVNEHIWFVLKNLSFVALGVVAMKFTKYLVVICLSPVISSLSQDIEEKLTGNKYPFSFKLLISDLKRGIKIAMRNMIWEFAFLLVVFIVVKFLDGNIAKILMFSLPLVFGFYYYGFSFIDYINERRRLNIEQSVYFVKSHRGLAIGIGAVYSLLFLCPLDFKAMVDFSDFGEEPLITIGSVFGHWIGWMVITAAPILAITSATLSMHEVVDLKTNEWAINTRKEVEEIEKEEAKKGLESNKAVEDSTTTNSSNEEN